MRINFFTLIGLTTFFFLFNNVVWSKNNDKKNNPSIELKKSKKQTRKTTPTKITSDKIDIKQKTQSVNFIGNVVVVKDDSSMLSDSMEVIYFQKNNQSQNNKLNKKSDLKKLNNEDKLKQKTEIEKIISKTKVKIFSDEFIAVGNSGYFDVKNNFFVLEGDVMVNNGISIARGDKFIHNLDNKKSSFVGIEKKKNNQDFVKDSRVTVILGDDVKEFKK